ncbi:MAG: ATP phosphoribosyltransferase regulatory subunit [Eggerthellaceae bacterium]
MFGHTASDYRDARLRADRLFVRGIGEATDVVSKEMFTAISGENLNKLLGGGTIKGKSRLSLRPEGTAGVVRAVVQHDLVPQGAAPAKLMYAGPMFRAERPQKGRQRQFNQVGIECLGAEDPSVDAEGIIMPCVLPPSHSRGYAPLVNSRAASSVARRTAMP